MSEISQSPRAEIVERLRAGHPTGKAPRTVLLVALGPSAHSLLNLTTAHEPPPFIMDVDEVWGVNGGGNHFAGRVAYDILWIMDFLDGELAREPGYIARIMQWRERHNGAIMTSAAGSFAGKPGIFEFPLADILALFGEANCYFETSVPYAIAYAMAIGVERLVLFGADYTPKDGVAVWETGTRACSEYWVGLSRGLGMSVLVPDTSDLLSSNNRPVVYGYPPAPPE